MCPCCSHCSMWRLYAFSLSAGPSGMSCQYSGPERWSITAERPRRGPSSCGSTSPQGVSGLSGKSEHR